MVSRMAPMEAPASERFLRTGGRLRLSHLNGRQTRTKRRLISLAVQRAMMEPSMRYSLPQHDHQVQQQTSFVTHQSSYLLHCSTASTSTLYVIPSQGSMIILQPASL